MSKRIRAIVDDVWERRAEATAPPPVILSDDRASAVDQADAIVLPEAIIGEVVGANATARKRQREQIVGAMTQILAAYEFFDELSANEQIELVESLFNVALEGQT